MRALKIILKIVFGLLFVASITLNLILGCSSTNKLIFGDSLKTRISLYSNVQRQLNAEDNFKNYTITKKHSTKENDVEKISTSTSSCTTDEQNVKKCTLVEEEKLGTEVIQNSYNIGDGKKYFVKGQENYFVVMDESTEMVLSNLEDFSKLGMLKVDVDLWNKEQIEKETDENLRQQMSIKPSVSFDFNTLSLVKEIMVTIVTPKFDQETQRFKDFTEITKFHFDGNDRIIGLSLEDSYQNTSVSYKITYQSTKLYLPDFKNFVEKEAE